jgi:hypothetical protein
VFFTVPLLAGTAYEMQSGFPWGGAVQAVFDTSGGNMVVTQY